MVARDQMHRMRLCWLCGRNKVSGQRVNSDNAVGGKHTRRCRELGHRTVTAHVVSASTHSLLETSRTYLLIVFSTRFATRDD